MKKAGEIKARRIDVCVCGRYRFQHKCERFVFSWRPSEEMINEINDAIRSVEKKWKR